MMASGTGHNDAAGFYHATFLIVNAYLGYWKRKSHKIHSSLE